MTEPTTKLSAMLVREGGTHVLYFCRGEGKCTKSQSERMRLSRLHKRCGDCIRSEGDDTRTIGDIVQKIERGDA